MMRNLESIHLGLVLCFGLLVTSIVLAQDYQNVEDPSALMKEINEKGAERVIQSLWGQPAWDSLIEDISSGEATWVNVALKLRMGSDAGATSELHDALFVALGKNPKYLLRVLEIEENSPRSSFLLGNICEGRDDPLSTYAEARAELVSTLSAVRKVKSKRLQNQKILCINKLKEANDQLTVFFGAKSSGSERN